MTKGKKRRRRGYLNHGKYPRRKWGKIGSPKSARRRRWCRKIGKKGGKARRKGLLKWMD